MLNRLLNRRDLAAVFTIFLVAGFLFGWSEIASLQSKTDKAEEPANERPITIRAPKRGGQPVNFYDGHELKAGSNAGGRQAIALAAADFDSDGRPDLVTADTSGRITEFKGAERVKPLGDGSESQTEPFDATGKTFSLGITPDFLFAGDFNADGKKDVIAASKNGRGIVALVGDGKGNFLDPAWFPVDGNISAIESGEIGRPDGQADLAIAYSNKNGSFLAVYEHPESAFKHAPEIIKLPSAATAIAIGNTDGDFYSDVAVACGNDLVIVHERGQVYPWDIDPKLGIKRPPPVVDVRRMPFAIAAMTVGRFGKKRGTTLALLGRDGNIYRLQPTHQSNPAVSKISAMLAGSSSQPPFLPIAKETREVSVFPDRQPSPDDAERLGLSMVDAGEIKSGNVTDHLKKRQDDLVEKYKNADKSAIEKILAAGNARPNQQNEQAKEAFVRSISANPMKLSSWTIETLVSGSRFATASESDATHKLFRVNVSDSNLDDLAVVDELGNQIQLVSQVTPTDENGMKTGGDTRISVASLETTANPVAVLPMRLNMDSLSDLVVLSRGFAVPSVVMSAPSSTILVTTANGPGSCSPGDDCNLYNAIQFSNTHSGVDTIQFATGPVTISLNLELPTITDGVNLFGDLDGNGQPTIEISGVNVPASGNGLAIRSSNSFIVGLNINSFRSTVSGTSQVGGNGITIFSTSLSPNNGNNTILACYLGTDKSGMLDKGNDATGINIFDSDNNEITQNVMSGNGTRDKNGTGLAVTASNSNGFINNIIGLNALGTAKVGNSYGMFFTGIDNRFGGDYSGEGNTVSGNGEVRPPTDSQPGCDGVGISMAQGVDLDTGEFLTLNNLIKGNRIGTNPAGTQGFGNCWWGVGTSPQTQTTIGSITQSGRNVISDNGLDAVFCKSTFNPSFVTGGFCSISGNNIGTNVAGTNALPNDWRNQRDGLVQETYTVDIVNDVGVSAVGSPGGTSPGGSCTGFCNLISGNNGDGLALGINGVGIIGVFDNFVGTDQTGTQSIPNINRGIGATGPNTTYIGLGSTEASFGNLVSGNSGAGIALGSTFGIHYQRAFVEGNLAGTDTSGMFALSNDVTQQGGFQGGIIAVNVYGDQFVIGGPGFEQRNVVSGNTFDNGMSVFSFGGQTSIINNLVGLNRSLGPLGNGFSGISLSGNGSQVTGNQIAYNGTIGNGYAGVVVINFSYQNTIRNNSIHDNNGLGIDLTNGFVNADGVTPNDCLDGDIGSNGLQNYPSLFAPTSNPDGSQSVTGYLRSSPAQDFQLDFYSNPTPDPTGYGEGAVYIGTKTIRTNGNGFTTFTYPVAGSAVNITATATDAFGNTSEFSCVAGQCTDPVRNIEEAESKLATSICADPIVVTTSGDQDDADLSDGTCDVDTDTPGMQCTLRAAIEEAEHQPGANAITFDIEDGSDLTISPATALPQMNQPVSIDASTQPGYAGVPLIVLNGSRTTDQYGLRLAGGDSSVRGLSVVNFKEGIGLSGEGAAKGRNRVTGNYLGLYPNGAAGAAPRQQFGITLVNGTTSNRVGGNTPEDRNVISGNVKGVSISASSTGNQIVGNYIGSDGTGSQAVPNDYGILITGSSNNQIGSEMDNGGNLISGNVEMGISIVDNSSGNKITGNQIGTDAGGMEALPNRIGIEVLGGSHDNFIGGTTEAQRNLISGQYLSPLSAAIVLRPDAGVNNQVTGNQIGVNKNLTGALANYFGIVVNADDQVIGSSNPADFPNLIGGSNFAGDPAGIYVHAIADQSNTTVENTVIQNNQIGAKPGGGTFPNYIGIYLFGDVKSTTITGNFVGGNSFAGIRLNQGPHNNTVSGNLVGITRNNTAMPNFNGIVIKQSDTNFVKDNVVSGNTANGIVIGDGIGHNNDLPAPNAVRRPAGTSSFATNNIITGNMVGTTVDGGDVIPNAGVAIGIGANARDNTVGGTGTLGNLVGGSTGPYGAGIFVGDFQDDDPQDLLPQNNKIIGNHVGVGNGSDPSALPNDYGIYVRNAVSTTIGGDTAAKGNVVGFNHVNGIRIFKARTMITTIQHNYVGVNPLGQAVGNESDGISIENAFPTVVQENTIGGNGGNGLTARDITANMSANRSSNRPNLGSGLVKIIGNIVGVIKVADLVSAVPNIANGIELLNVENSVIGDLADSFNKQNVIAGNGGSGISILGGSFNQILGGVIGTSLDGTTNVGNGGDGIKIVDAAITTIQQTTVAGNGGSGVLAQDIPADPGGARSVTISGVHSGFLKALNGLSIPLPNQGDGVKFGNVVGGTIGDQVSAALKNIIVCNHGSGIVVEGEQSVGNVIANSLIGTDENGSPGLGNSGDGVALLNAIQTILGSIENQNRNVISNNGRSAVLISGALASLNKIQNNLMGVAPNGNDPLGNLGNGVLISEGANINSIGGPGDNEGNLIAFNGGAGVRIDETAGSGNLVDPNLIYANNGLGIDIGSAGHTPNDPDDGDMSAGGNPIQNYPEVSAFTIDGNGDLLVTYSVDSAPGNSDYGTDGLYVEFFKSDAGGQGQVFLGSDHYTVSDHGAANRRKPAGNAANAPAAGGKTINLGNAAALGFSAADRVTATATDAQNNTSEFFPPFAPTAAEVTVSGRVLESSGRPLGSATITITDDHGSVRRAISNAFGYYSFADVEVGRTYIVSASHKQRRFARPTVVLSLQDAVGDVDFMAEE